MEGHCQKGPESPKEQEWGTDRDIYKCIYKTRCPAPGVGGESSEGESMYECYHSCQIDSCCITMSQKRITDMYRVTAQIQINYVRLTFTISRMTEFLNTQSSLMSSFRSIPYEKK